MTITDWKNLDTDQNVPTPKAAPPSQGKFHRIDLGVLGAIMMVGDSTHVTVEYMDTKMEFDSWTEAKTAASVITMYAQQIHDAFTLKAHIDRVKYDIARSKVHTAVTGRVEFGKIHF